MTRVTGARDERILNGGMRRRSAWLAHSPAQRFKQNRALGENVMRNDKTSHASRNEFLHLTLATAFVFALALLPRLF